MPEKKAARSSTQSRKYSRQAQQRSIETREKIEQAALTAFSSLGFAGASTSHIAKIAGVSQQLVVYHYKTKRLLWQASAGFIFTKMDDHLGKHMSGHENVHEHEKLALLLKAFIHFSATHPELVGFVLQENHANSEHHDGSRNQWLVENHIRPLHNSLIASISQAQAQGIASSGDPAYLSRILFGAVSTFSLGIETQRLTVRNITDPQEVDSFADLVIKLLLPNIGAS